MVKSLASIVIFLFVFWPGLTVAVNTALSEPSVLLVKNKELSGNEAARLVQRQTRGKVLKVSNSGSGYRVRVLLPNGVVRVFHVNKVTGTIR